MKALVTIHGSEVAPRFDLATEVVIAVMGGGGTPPSRRTMVLPQSSAEDLCHLILTEGADVVVCGGIEEEFYQYLTWKKVRVLDSVIGPWSEALRLLFEGGLEAESVIRPEARGDG